MKNKCVLGDTLYLEMDTWRALEGESWVSLVSPKIV